jgi:hypothetical protein
MNRNELSDEQKKLVWRYVEVWQRFRRLPDGYRSFAKLEDDLAQGSGMFLCGLSSKRTQPTSSAPMSRIRSSTPRSSGTTTARCPI